MPFSRHAKAQTSLVLVIWLYENVLLHAHFLAMPSSNKFGFGHLALRKRSFTCSFSRHAKAQTSLVLVIWLYENVLLHAHFLAMPKLKQVWFWSSGFTKMFFSYLQIETVICLTKGMPRFA